MNKNANDTISTRIISQRELTLDGVVFSWWAVHERPSLVTVRSPVFGSLSDFTTDDVAAFAIVLAKRILSKHTRVPRNAVSDALQKAGWFEPGGTDYASTTIF